MSVKTTVLNLPEEEFIYPGNRACAGCGLGIIYRIATKALGKNTLLVVPPSCLTVVQGLYPIAATKLPCVNVTFASTAAAATGVTAALAAQKKEGITVAAWAGDGGTADIGIQALSGACERGDDFIFFCYDNEAYMNTGVQRSGTTPAGVITTNTPFKGKLQKPKDIPSIMAAHGINYVATCSASFPLDLYLAGGFFQNPGFRMVFTCPGDYFASARCLCCQSSFLHARKSYCAAYGFGADRVTVYLGIR
jgi:pyruvate ferredoxin oxidoreductase beta subunit